MVVAVGVSDTVAVRVVAAVRVVEGLCVPVPVTVREAEGVEDDEGLNAPKQWPCRYSTRGGCQPAMARFLLACMVDYLCTEVNRLKQVGFGLY